MPFKLIYHSFFLSFIFIIGCTNDVQIVERKTEDNQVERAYCLPSARYKGFNSPEVDFLSDEKISQTSETLINNVGTTQEELNQAITLLYRMKKSDYERTWLLYLEHQLENIKNTPQESKTFIVSGAKNRMNYWKIIFDKCQTSEVSYVRLPIEQRKKIRAEAKEEIRGVAGVMKSVGGLLEEFFD